METELEYLRSCLAAAEWNIRQKEVIMGNLIDALRAANQVEIGRRAWIEERLKEEGNY